MYEHVFTSPTIPLHSPFKEYHVQCTMYILTVRRAVCSKLDYHFAKFNLTNFTSFTTLLHLHTCKLSKKDFSHLRHSYKIFFKKTAFIVFLIRINERLRTFFGGMFKLL
jgi:hypothetical protein